MKKIEIYDPAMCCSTGVCGTSVDPELVRVAADMEKLKKAGIEVLRYNLSQDTGAFAANQQVRQLLNDEGPEVLPIIIINNTVEKKRGYLTRSEMEALFGLDLSEHEQPKENLFKMREDWVRS